MELIASTTVGAGGATTITFSSIPQTYTDLVIFLNARSALSAAQSGHYLRFNSDGANNYTWRSMQGDGSNVAAAASSFGYLGLGPGSTAAANTFGNLQIYIPNYTGSNRKIWYSELAAENTAIAEVRLLGGSWNNTAALTAISLNFEDQGANLVQYSTASLYGILKGSGGATVS